MRIPGYCERCRKMRTVRVARFAQGRVQVGICAACEAEQDRIREERARPKKGR